MEQKREKTIALGLAVVLLIVGVVCLTAFSAKKPETPIRIMFKSTAGDVLFNHRQHVDDYGLDCTDCHHEFDESEQKKPEACSACHPEDETGEVPKISDVFHEQCIDCHKDAGGPVKCSGCHIL